MWPTQLTHGSIIAFKRDEDGQTTWKMATSLEHMGALGWRMYGESDVFPVCKMRDVISKLELTPQQVKMLAGNSMHLRTQMAFMWYALGHCALKQKKFGPEHVSFQRVSTFEKFEDSQ